MRIERTVDIAADPQAVWDVVMDPQRLGEWVTIHQGVADAPDGNLREGSTLKQTLKLAGRKFTVNWKVAKVDDRSHVVWEGRGPLGSRARVEYGFAPDGDGTRFSYVNEYQLPGGVLGKAAAPAVRRFTTRELDGTLQRLKKLVE